MTHAPEPTLDRPTDSWSDLVTAALLGTDRRPVADLLDQAALQAVARRAGLRPGPASPLPAAAPADARPALPEAARLRLGMLLPPRGGSGSTGAGGYSGSSSSGGSGSLANLNELLPQWLADADRHGYRCPAELVPPLLDAARVRSELRADAVALAGPLGYWLAHRNPDWRYVLRTPLPDEGLPEPDRQLWQEGLFAERVTHLTRLRRRDPATALELLRSTWSSERAEDRLLFLDALQEGLGAEDEPFLEAALSDRAKNVRLTAAELLSTLPGSALARRMAQRALACVVLSGTADGPRLTVHPPTACDAAMQRDGIAAASPTGRADRAFWLGEIVAATPLDAWTGAYGSPDELLALPVSDAWQQDLRDAWARAAVRQGDARWARALLALPAEDSIPVGSAAKLLAVLGPEERADWTTGFLAGHGLADAFQLLVACTAPWPQPLGRAVLGALAQVAAAGGYPWSHSGVIGVAERSLPPEAAAELAALAEGAVPAWSETFTRLGATLHLRATMLAELQP
ncbi:hypothetical protein GXW83_29695 [Streptacidiphilus sp. PB12-B1b]|uniref:DUF5691 domain-containing protein n=1 Tax=Streptacidiphilus sp. PB12-B1b TaxID=2705012 RepID=UPI0015FB4353|nr:DUF5691 domain-containing protein [Streptacidiphilus sp. PB12-B1b]QMU79259.1 hypothetical protein GXW83_29695 [Streptacidiphilus sp. PB12-B1b]